ncbi:hypothetical protein MRB53_016171 [Persea americana]|uniref:Uncharacterized protein n=1 Tax=Persea americana TaxID=3435 RepID=A0ACC2M159_PERAE|nr:hypothetical protein MRB53_016171 [Persea americana]
MNTHTDRDHLTIRTKTFRLKVPLRTKPSPVPRSVAGVRPSSCRCQVFRDEERFTSSEAVDIICDSEREIDSGHDDQNTPYRQSLSFQSEASDGPESWPGCQTKWRGLPDNQPIDSINRAGGGLRPLFLYVGVNLLVFASLCFIGIDCNQVLSLFEWKLYASFA